MNWARGFFRLWVVLSILWVVAIALLEGLPDLQSYARQMQRTDVTAFEVSASPNPDGSYTMEADGRSFVIEIAGTVPPASDAWQRMLEDVAQQFNRDAEEANTAVRVARQSSVLGLLLLAAIPPVLLLMLGSSLLWAFRGFRRSI